MEAEEGSPLIELLPRRVRYEYDDNLEIAYGYEDGSRLRHYENIESNVCHGMDIELPLLVTASWLDTDCVSGEDHGSYADYYKFTLTEERTVLIDLKYKGNYKDTYLYLIRGGYPAGRWSQRMTTRRAPTRTSRPS